MLKIIRQIFDNVTEAESKAAVAWVIGEFAEYLNDSFQLISKRVESLENEERNVQLQVLTAGVKIYLKFPDEGEVFI